MNSLRCNFSFRRWHFVAFLESIDNSLRDTQEAYWFVIFKELHTIQSIEMQSLYIVLTCLNWPICKSGRYQYYLEKIAPIYLLSLSTSTTMSSIRILYKVHFCATFSSHFLYYINCPIRSNLVHCLHTTQFWPDFREMKLKFLLKFSL